MNKQERIEACKKLVEGKGFVGRDNPDVRAFYKESGGRGGGTFVSNNVPQLGLFRSPYSRDLDGVDIALVGLPMDLGVPNPRPGTRNAPKAVRFWALIEIWSTAQYIYAHMICAAS